MNESTRFALRLIQSRYADRWFRRLSLEEKQDLLLRVWADCNKGLSHQERYLLMRAAYEDRRMKNYALLDSAAQAKIYGYFSLVNEIRSVEGDVVETGVGRVVSLAALVYAVAYFNLGKVVYGFDSFAGFPPASQEDISPRVSNVEKVSGWENTSPEMIYSIFEFERQKYWERSLLAQRDVQVKLFPGYFEQTIPAHLPPKIALLHVDCDLYQSYKTVLEHGWPRMNPGGLIVFDEYGEEKWPGATKAVDEFCEERGLRLTYFEPLQRHMVKVS